MKTGVEKVLGKKILKKLKRIKKTMEQTVSDTSSSPDQNIQVQSQTQSSPNHPIKSDRTWKLDGDQIMRIISLVATFVKPAEVVRTIQEEYGVKIQESLVRYYRNHPDYQAPIQKIRERWGNDLLHVELANKRRRMEELSRIYEHCFETDQMKNALTSLYQIQHEVEKDLNNLSLTNYNVNIYKDMSVEELMQEKMKVLDRYKQLKGELAAPANELKEDIK